MRIGVFAPLRVNDRGFGVGVRRGGGAAPGTEQVLGAQWPIAGDTERGCVGHGRQRSGEEGGVARTPGSRPPGLDPLWMRADNT